VTAAPPRFPPPRRAMEARRRLERLVFGLAVVAVAGVLGTLGFGLAYAHVQSQIYDTTAVRSAAAGFLADLTNWSPATVDGQFNRVQAMATGAFARQAAAVFNPAVRAKLRSAKAATTGRVTYLFVQSYNGKAASVFGVVDQTYSNSASRGTHSAQLHLVVDLAKVAGRWKVDSLLSLTGSATPTP